jgi:putative transposase
MDGSICLSEEERKVLLQACRSGSCVRTVRRAQIVLLLAKGWSYREVREATFASFELIRDCLTRFGAGRVNAVLQSSEPGKQPPWWRRVLTWLTKSQPEDFGYYRTRWSCAMLAEVLAWETGLRRSAETVRRALRRLNWVWRRPRPIVGPTDPDYHAKLRQIHTLLANLPAEETAVFQDEVDVNLNPKIGSCWMRRGEQAEVRTPGNNEKRHVAGSLHWRTGSLVVSPAGRSRDSRLFINHLDDLRRRLRGYRMIHVICDNAAFHCSRAVQTYLARWACRLKIHFLPKYAPETNPIERVWWHFHETITRNHRCESLSELLGRAYDWFNTHQGFYFEMNRILAAAA